MPGLVRCLFDRAKNITRAEDDLLKEEKHLSAVLKRNGYPTGFISRSSVPLPRRREEGQAVQEPTTTVVIPYTAGMSEDIRRICRRFNIRVAFRSSRTLRSMLSNVKDKVPMEKRSGVVYRIPCSCGKVYLGETRRRLETRLKEHKDACKKGQLEKSAIAEHAWTHQHAIEWGKTVVVDQASRHTQLLLKEAISIQLTPEGDRLNRDEGLELPGCWTAAIRAVARRDEQQQRVRLSTPRGTTSDPTPDPAP